MTNITCHNTACLNNKRSKCVANAVVVGSKGKCKACVYAADLMMKDLKSRAKD